MDQMLQSRRIDFDGDTLVAARDNDGVIWVGVSYVCNGIGLTKSQKDSQVDKIQTDNVLKMGCRKFPAGVFDTYNSTLAIQLDYLPLWLAKISVTPKMMKESPEVADRLIRYQLKAKDVLAEAFSPDKKEMSVLDLIESQLRVLRDVKAEQERQAAEIEFNRSCISNISDVIVINPENWRNDVHDLIYKIADCRGGHARFGHVQNEIYKAFENRAGVNLKRRYNNKIDRMIRNGASKDQCNRLNRVDIIADDKRLVEIYLAIVKEMAIKYGVSV